MKCEVLWEQLLLFYTCSHGRNILFKIIPYKYRLFFLGGSLRNILEMQEGFQLQKGSLIIL